MVLTNVYGCALTIRATMPALKESKGHLLLTSSVAGRRALPGSLYSATKHAVTAMGEAARQDLNDTGVRVTLIEPGMADTPFFDEPAEDPRAGGRRHRPRGDVRGLPAAARRRQRDPDPADGTADVDVTSPKASATKERLAWQAKCSIDVLLLLLFALIAGAGTALSPCVLPILPALLSAGATGGRRRPLGIVLGLAITFTITIAGLAEVVDGVGLATARCAPWPSSSCSASACCCSCRRWPTASRRCRPG